MVLSFNRYEDSSNQIQKPQSSPRTYGDPDMMLSSNRYKHDSNQQQSSQSAVHVYSAAESPLDQPQATQRLYSAADAFLSNHPVSINESDDATGILQQPQQTIHMYGDADDLLEKSRISMRPYGHANSLVESHRESEDFHQYEELQPYTNTLPNDQHPSYLAVHPHHTALAPANVSYPDFHGDVVPRSRADSDLHPDYVDIEDDDPTLSIHGGYLQINQGRSMALRSSCEYLQTDPLPYDGGQ